MQKPFRDELKYIIRSEHKNILLEKWKRHLARDPHTNADATTPVLSQYYDSPTLLFYREKLDGIHLRNKVRLRTYGYRFEEGETAFIEVKQRLDNKVRKFRLKIDCYEDKYLDPKNWDLGSKAEVDLANSLVQKYHLRESAQVFYQREAYFSIVEPDVRVTFDSVLTSLMPGEILTTGRLMSPEASILPETFVILEVKATGGIPSWVTDGAKSIELIQKTVPKYVMAVEHLKLNEMITCGGYV